MPVLLSFSGWLSASAWAYAPPLHRHTPFPCTGHLYPNMPADRPSEPKCRAWYQLWLRQSALRSGLNQRKYFVKLNTPLQPALLTAEHLLSCAGLILNVDDSWNRPKSWKIIEINIVNSLDWTRTVLCILQRYHREYCWLLLTLVHFDCCNNCKTLYYYFDTLRIMVHSWKIICLQCDKYFYFLLRKYCKNPVTTYFYLSLTHVEYFAQHFRHHTKLHLLALSQPDQR